MKKAASSILIAGVLLAVGVISEAQQPTKLPKIGFLTAGFGELARWRENLVREFGKLGYIEGRNITFEVRNANTKYDRLPALADELVRLKVDVIVTPGANDTRAAKNATKTIPIVFTGGGSDPVTLGLVESLARPGGNVTGFAQIATQLAGKRLELLKETVPKLSRVVVLWDPQNAGSKEIWEESQRQAKGLGLQLHSLGINSAAELESGFKDAVKAGSGALAWTSGALLGSVAKQTINLTAKNRMPTIYHRQSYVADGALMSYGPDESEPYRRAALMVDKILKGTKPADIPVEQPTKFELAINLKSAKALGLTIPPAVLMRAEKVIR